MTDSDVLAKRLLALCGERRLMLATAESCTGGLVAAALTAIPGSSTVFERGFVTYSNEAKTDMLGVKQSTLAEFGAVSRETAAEMAQGALHRSRADVAVSVTGIAGPGGGSVEKPVGLVWFGVAGKAVAASAASRQFPSDSRDVIRGLAVVTALDLLIAALLPGQAGPAAP